MQLANSSSLLVPRLVIKNKMVLPNGLGSRYDPLHFQFDPCSSWARITSMQHFSKLQRSSSQVLHCPFNQHQALPCLWLPLRRHCWSLRVMRSEFSTLFDTPEQSSTWYSRYLLWISRESRWLVGLLCLKSLAFRSLATVASTKNPLLHWPTTTPVSRCSSHAYSWLHSRPFHSSVSRRSSSHLSVSTGRFGRS